MDDFDDWEPPAVAVMIPSAVPVSGTPVLAANSNGKLVPVSRTPVANSNGKLGSEGPPPSPPDARTVSRQTSLEDPKGPSL